MNLTFMPPEARWCGVGPSIEKVPLPVAKLRSDQGQLLAHRLQLAGSPGGLGGAQAGLVGDLREAPRGPPPHQRGRRAVLIIPPRLHGPAVSADSRGFPENPVFAAFVRFDRSRGALASLEGASSVQTREVLDARAPDRPGSRCRSGLVGAGGGRAHGLRPVARRAGRAPLRRRSGLLRRVRAGREFSDTTPGRKLRFKIPTC